MAEVTKLIKNYQRSLILYSAKRWQRKTLANHIGEKTLANHQLRRSSRNPPPDASSGPAVKLWQIEVRRNIETTSKTLQRVVAPQREHYTVHIMATPPS